MLSKTIAGSSNIPFISARNRLLGWGALIAAIYAGFLFLFPLFPSIDQSKTVLDVEMMLKDGRKWFALFYIFGLLATFFAYWRMMKIVHAFSKEEPEAANGLRFWVLGIGIVCALLLIGLYPITALDVVLYVVRARLWALYGGSPMLTLPAHFPQDPFIRFAGEYKNQPSPYGPLWELIAQIPIRLCITGIGSGTIAMKIISLISYVCTAVLLGWHSQQQSPRYEVSNLTALTFFAVNPLVLLQTIGNGHNDMVMMAFMTLGLIWWQRGKWVETAFALTLATLIKVTGFILIPLFGMAVLAASPNWRTRFTRGFIVAAIFIVTTLIAFRLTGPLPAALEGTKTALFGRLGYSPSYAMRILVNQFTRDLHTIQLPTNIGNYLFVLYYLYLLFQLATKKMTLLEAGFMAFFSQLFLGSTFRIWYPLWLIPFAALNLNSSTYWRTFLFGITAELSILTYFLLWRWILGHWNWPKTTAFRPHWEYWFITTWITVPWAFGIPLLVPWLRRRKDSQRFDNTLWI